MLVIGNFGLSEEQERTHMAFWALFTAPLIFSAEIRPGSGYYQNGMRERSKALLQNANLIRINQDPLGERGIILFRVFLKPV